MDFPPFDVRQSEMVFFLLWNKFAPQLHNEEVKKVGPVVNHWTRANSQSDDVTQIQATKPANPLNEGLIEDRGKVSVHTGGVEFPLDCVRLAASRGQ